MSLRTLLHPELSHHAALTRPFFEGWYCKMVTARGEMLAIIPGYFKGKNPSEDHAFIQIYDTIRNRSAFIRYPPEAFHASSTSMEIEIEGTRFTRFGITLAIDAQDDQGIPWNLKGTVRFSELRPWPRGLLAPNAMGWYSFVPFMECNHAVLSFDHALQGRLSEGITGATYDFSDGRGYIEKDWGSSFPSDYLWLQGNRFAQHPGASIFLSIATIPWLGSSFPGHIGGLWSGEKGQEFFLFAQYNGSSILALRADEKDVITVLHRGTLILRACAHRDRAVPLSAPYHGSMQTKILESAGTTVTVELYRLPRPVASRAIIKNQHFMEALCTPCGHLTHEAMQPASPLPLHSQNSAHRIQEAPATPYHSHSSVPGAEAAILEADVAGTELLFQDTTTASCLETVGDLTRLNAMSRAPKS